MRSSLGGSAGFELGADTFFGIAKGGGCVSITGPDVGGCGPLYCCSAGGENAGAAGITGADVMYGGGACCAVD